MPFVGKVNQDIAVTFDKPGVYGVKCLPHYGMGMVALVVVGTPANKDEAMAVTHPGKAKQVFATLFGKLAPRARRRSRSGRAAMAPIPRLKPYAGPCALLLRLPAVLPVRRALCGARGAGVAADLHRRTGTRLRVRAAGLACARDALRLCAGGRYRLPADRHSELDRPAAAARHTADRAAAGLGRGPRGGDAIGPHRLASRLR